MTKKHRKTGSRHGLQAVTLCISTAMVLVLLGMVVFSVLSAQNLSAYVKENLTVTMVLSQDMSNPEAKALTNQLRKLPYINRVEYISKEQVLKEQTEAMGTDPSEFTRLWVQWKCSSRRSMPTPTRSSGLPRA